MSHREHAAPTTKDFPALHADYCQQSRCETRGRPAPLLQLRGAGGGTEAWVLRPNLGPVKHPGVCFLK